MTRHVPDDRLLDLVEGEGSAMDRGHVGGCGHCAARVESVREGLDLARRADVPEPHPLYWEALRRNVGRRIAEETRLAPRWAWLVPLLAAALTVVALWPPAGPAERPAPSLSAWSALPAVEDDPSLPVLEAFFEESPETLDDPRPAGAILAALSDDESRELAVLLEGNAEGGDS